MKKTIAIVMMLLMSITAVSAALSGADPVDGVYLKQDNETFEITNTVNSDVDLSIYNDVGMIGLEIFQNLACVGAGPFTCTAITDLSSLNNGQTYYYFYFDSGIRDPNAGSYNFTVDGDIPSTTFTTAQSNITDDTIDYTIDTCTDATSLTMCEIQISTDNASWSVAGPSPIMLPGDNTYYLRSIAVDQAGNQYVSPSQVVTLDTPPNQILNFVVTPIVSGALDLTFDQGDADLLNYVIYRSNDGVLDAGDTQIVVPVASLADTLNPEYRDTPLTEGQTYYYWVFGEDATGEGPNPSNMAVGTVLDLTPPSAPTFNPANGTTFTDVAPSIDAMYSEVVHLFLTWNGLTYDWGWGQNFDLDFSAIPQSNDYNFGLVALDFSGNSLTTDYDFTVVNTGTAITNVTIVVIQDIVPVTGITPVEIIPVKTSVKPGENAIIGIRLQMDDGNYSKGTFTDLTATIPTDGLYYCQSDYDAVTETVIGGSPVYNMVSGFDDTQNAITCPVTDLGGGLIEYIVYQEIPIPASVTKGTQLKLSLNFQHLDAP